jgi:two-component system sensor histidine kinase AtoS
MKKKIILGLSVFSLVFFMGGIYIISAIEESTAKLDSLITLHQVEILREHLLLSIKRVQSDLNLRNTRYARSIDTIVDDVKNMGQAARSCNGCHHSEKVMEKLNDLQASVDIYKDSISRVFTIRANEARILVEEDAAFRTGEELTEKVKNIIAIASSNVAKKTRTSLREINNTKKILFILVGIGPIIAIGLTFFLIRGLTKPVDILLNAIRKIKGGNLDFRIEGLEDEFGEVAAAINDMSASLIDHIGKVEDSEKRYRTLFESAGDAIFILEAEGEKPGTIFAANKAASDMHGYMKDELIGMNITDLDTLESTVGSPEKVQRMLKGEWIKTEITHCKKDGTIFPVEVSAGLIEIGNHKYILTFDRDITNRKQAEEALQRTEQLKMVGELAAGLAHEIKNPLAGIEVSIELLLEELPLTERDRDVLLKVIDEIKRIEISIRELLSFAKPPSPEFHPVTVNAVMDKAMTFSLKNPSFSSIRLMKEYDDSNPDIMADPVQMHQVFMNLLLNAAEAMPGGGTLTVKTCVDEPSNTLQVTISDTGKGFDKASREKLFQPFFTTKAKGTGLGLAVTKRLIEQNNGAIIAENNIGGGASFRIVFPIGQKKN